MIKTMLPKLIERREDRARPVGRGDSERHQGASRQFGLSETKGALVSQVAKDSAAEKAGIKVGDVIVRYNGHDVPGCPPPAQLGRGDDAGHGGEDRGRPPGQGGDADGHDRQAGGRPRRRAAPGTEGAGVLSKLGLGVQTLTPDLAKQLGVEAAKGVVITDVAEGSLASLAGLQKGDVIVEADRQPVANADALEQVLAKAKDKSNVLLLINRQGGSLFVVLQMK